MEEWVSINLQATFLQSVIKIIFQYAFHIRSTGEFNKLQMEKHKFNNLKMTFSK